MPQYEAPKPKENFSGFRNENKKISRIGSVMWLRGRRFLVYAQHNIAGTGTIDKAIYNRAVHQLLGYTNKYLFLRQPLYMKITANLWHRYSNAVFN